MVQLKDTIFNENGNETTVVDNTYLPIWQGPLKFGVDIVCYSATTKFLNGHSDSGGYNGLKEKVSKVKNLRTFLGSMIAPLTALFTRSLETFIFSQ